MNSNDYIVVMKVARRGVADGKPFCDGCNSSIPSDENDDYSLNCLILDGESFHSVQCEDCFKKYFKGISKLNENEVPKEMRQTIRLVMSRNIEVTFP